MKKPQAITQIVKQADYWNFIPYDDSDLDLDECWELVKQHCRENNVRITGFIHQEKYLPIIDDRYIFLESLRVWGALMAEVWSEVDGIEYKYSNWAWWMPVAVTDDMRRPGKGQAKVTEKFISPLFDGSSILLSRIKFMSI